MSLAATGGVRGAISDAYARGEAWVLDEKRATYGASVARIVMGLTIVAFVLANAGVVRYHWGDASGWADPVRATSNWGWPFDIVFSHTEPVGVFLLFYWLLGLAGLALAAGCYPRIAAIVALFLYVSLVEGNPLAVDQTDNATRIILFFFCFTDMSQHWSVDAWRRSRPGHKRWRDRMPVLERLDWLPTILHNFALIAVALQLFVIYTVAGLSKVQGVSWQNGTALWYPLNVYRFEPWPALSHLLGGNALIVMVGTYVAVFAQLFFALLLLARWTRRIALLAVLALHGGIAIFLGLPLFSAAMLAADTIFVSSTTYAWLEAWVRRRVQTRNPR